MAQIIGDKNIGETVRAVDSLLDGRDTSAAAESDFDALSERFHSLVDKEFLGTLTSEEEEELKKLTVWQAEQRSAFYKMALGT